MSSISSYGPSATHRYPALLGPGATTGGAAPVAQAPAPAYAASTYAPTQAYAPAATQGVLQAPVTAASAQYNWNYANPRDHIFDHPYDGYAMNKGLMKLGGVGFWTRFGVTRSIASAITKIPEQRLHAYAVREKFMKVQGMKPDYARLLQISYFNKTGGQMPLQRNAPLSFLGQFGAPGDVNDWVLRGPFLLELHASSVQYAMSSFYKPEVPGNRELENLARGAMMIAPPQYAQQPGYGGQPQYPGYGQPQYPGYPQQPGYGGYPGYGGDPITQIGNLIGQIGQIFR